MQQLNYSAHFTTLFEQTEPSYGFGYSVFRCTEFYLARHDTFSSVPKNHNFCVIWDENHDALVIKMAEQLYAELLFYPVLFIRERKGFLTITLDGGLYLNTLNKKTYRDAVQTVVDRFEFDSWNLVFEYYDSVTERLIPYTYEYPEPEMEAYMNGINQSGPLGLINNG